MQATRRASIFFAANSQKKKKSPKPKVSGTLWLRGWDLNHMVLANSLRRICLRSPRGSDSPPDCHSLPLGRSLRSLPPGYHFVPFAVPEDSKLPRLAFRPLHSSAPSLYHPQDALGFDSQRATLVGLITLISQRFTVYTKRKIPQRRSVKGFFGCGDGI